MEPNLSGRTVRGLQSRHKALSETYREKFSDLAKLQLDQAGNFPLARCARELIVKLLTLRNLQHCWALNVWML